MATINFTIPDAKLPLLVNAIKHAQPVPTESGGTPSYTDNEWAKEWLRRKLILTVHQYQKFLASEAVVPDEDIAT